MEQAGQLSEFKNEYLKVQRAEDLLDRLEERLLKKIDNMPTTTKVVEVQKETRYEVPMQEVKM